MWLIPSLSGQWFLLLIHSLLHFPPQHMVPSRGHPVKKGRGVIVDPKVRIAILSPFSSVMTTEVTALLEATPSGSECGTFRISAKTLSWFGAPSPGLSLSVGHLCSRANLVFSFLQVTLGQWAHQDDKGTGDQKERRERKVGTRAIPRRAGFDCQGVAPAHPWE